MVEQCIYGYGNNVRRSIVMAWGYAKGFVIEYVMPPGKKKANIKKRKRRSCRNCLNYDKTLQKCSLSPKYLSINGRDAWKRCGFYNITIKNGKQTSTLKVDSKVIANSVNKTNSQDRTNNKSLKIIRKQDCKNLHLIFCTGFKNLNKQKRQMATLEIELLTGRKIHVNSCIVESELYVLSTNLSEERKALIIQMFG